MLILRLYKKYFREIQNGTKTKEYRKNTPYYRSRIRDSHGVVKHDCIKFINGYASNAPYMIVELKDVVETDTVFTLYLGRILSQGNLND